jgi:uncharacterized membrane protein SpoIIM required for sporulation
VISNRWLDARRTHWERLEDLVERARRGGLARFVHGELQELGLLYRQAASDLSVVREDPSGRRIAAYLNQLLGRAHNVVYRHRPAGPGGVLHFFREAYPRALRESLGPILAAASIFLAAGLAGFLVCLRDPGFPRFVLGDAMIETIERREMWTHSIVSMKPLASSAIMTNNIAVALAAVAAGITAGVGTLYLMALNGLLLGTVAAACHASGMSLPLWSFVAPHGALELPAIAIAGGAGLAIGRGLLFPGLLPRRDSLVLAGRRAAHLTLGTVAILVVAGVLEGFVSPSALPAGAKLLLGTALAGLLALYLAQGGRRPEGRARPQASPGRVARSGRAS